MQATDSAFNGEITMMKVVKPAAINGELETKSSQVMSTSSQMRKIPKQSNLEKSRKQVHPKRAAQPYPLKKEEGAKSGRVPRKLKGPKKPAKELTLAERVDLIKTYELYHCSFRLLCQKYGVSMGTVHNVLKRKLLYLELYNKEFEKDKAQRPTYSPALIETHLFQWYQSMQSAGVAVTKDGVKQKAAELANAVSMPLYAISDQWLDNFIERYKVDCASLKVPVKNSLVSKKCGRRRKRKPMPCTTPVSMVPREEVGAVSSKASKDMNPGTGETTSDVDESIEQQIYQYADTSSFTDVPALGSEAGHERKHEKEDSRDSPVDVITVKSEPPDDYEYYENMGKTLMWTVGLTVCV